MIRYLVILVVCLVALSCAPRPSTASAATHKPCATNVGQWNEDEPCWSWVSNGNGARGVVTLYGNLRVVDACEFGRLWYAGHLAYTVRVGGVTYRHLLERLRGDATARAKYRSGQC